MTRDEVKKLLLYIKSQHPEFVIDADGVVADGWEFTFELFDGQTVMQAARKAVQRNKYPPKPQEIVAVIEEGLQLEWPPEGIAVYLCTQSYHLFSEFGNRQKALDRCPPNVQRFVASLKPTIVEQMSDRKLVEYVRMRAKLFNRQCTPQQPALPEGVQKMIEGIGG